MQPPGGAGPCLSAWRPALHGGQGCCLHACGIPALSWGPVSTAQRDRRWAQVLMGKEGPVAVGCT